MNNTLFSIAASVAAAAFFAWPVESRGAVADGEALEIMALIDHYDLAAIPDPDRKGQYLFDSETPEGCEKILDHVLLTGAQTVLWRPESGSMMRYHSKEEGFLNRRGMDKRRMILHQEPVYTWVRYAESEVDLIDYMLGNIRQRGLCSGFHWPFEETHWASWTFGPYNLEHPQYWGRSREGVPWCGRTSLAYPDAMAHKMRVVDELLAMKPEVIFIDCWRNGGWGPKYEYVEPQLERWRRKHGDAEPPAANDIRWCEHVAETVHDFYRQLQSRIEASGLSPKPRVLVGFPVNSRGGAREEILRKYGIDWQKLVEEKLVDGIVVMDVAWDPKRPAESAFEYYRELADLCRGKCQIFFPVQAYDFTGKSFYSFAKAMGVSNGKATEKLLELARQAGGDGVVLEVVDYRNYPDDVCAALRAEAARGPVKK